MLQRLLILKCVVLLQMFCHQSWARRYPRTWTRRIPRTTRAS